MLFENLALFLDLYHRPRRAFSGILDQGSILFGAVLVVIVSGIMAAGLTVQLMVTSAQMGAERSAGRSKRTR